MTSEIRPYVEADFEGVARHWHEIGWLDDKESEKEMVRHSISASSVSVGLVGGEAEAVSFWVPGLLRYLDADLALAVITAITTSPVARRHKFASRLTARAMAEAAASGSEACALGIFDQGFYDRLGFGTGPYDHRVTFDPALLEVEVPDRSPVRLTAADHAEIHALMARRFRPHGGVVLEPPELTEAVLSYIERGYGLGFRDDGRLTHFVYLTVGDGKAPCDARWYGYETPAQLIELLGVMKSLSDQLVSIRMIEPQQIQFQDYIRRPFRDKRRTESSVHGYVNEAIAWWQMRILDVESCLSRVRWREAAIAVNIVVEDPAEQFLEGEWRGVGGQYIVRFDETTTVERGRDPALETVTCTVNCLTRWWLGVASASNLSLTGGFDASDNVLAALDSGLRVPSPVTGWDF